MQEFVFWFGLVANAITVLAGIIAIAGVVWAILGRARLSVTHWLSPGLAPSLTLTVTSTGSNPLHDLELSVGTLDDNGFAMMGDGAGRRTTLSRGEALSVVGYETREISFGSEARDGEVRFEIQRGHGFYLNVQWRSPLFPWRRSSRTYAWPPLRRFASQMPEELTGRKELAFLRRTQDPALNPTLPGFVAPSNKLARALEASDETFDALVEGHRGPVLVAFCATWQGQWWEDLRRMLDSFAVRHSPRVKVLVVRIDQCPHLAERFTIDVLPAFKFLREGEVVKSHGGVGSLPELELEFAEHLR